MNYRVFVAIFGAVVLRHVFAAYWPGFKAKFPIPAMMLTWAFVLFFVAPVLLVIAAFAFGGVFMDAAIAGAEWLKAHHL